MRASRSALAIAAFVLALRAGAAFAHAFVVASEPKPQQVVTGPDLAIEIRFNARVDAGRSRLTLKRPEGSSVILPLEPTRDGDGLRSQASPLSSGAYELQWQTLSVDGHITRGVIPFRVGP